MSEYLSKEEIKQWRSSLEKITLEEFAARLGKKIEEAKPTNDLIDIVLQGKPVMSTEETWLQTKGERISTIAQRAFDREQEIAPSPFSISKIKIDADVEPVKPAKSSENKTSVKSTKTVKDKSEKTPAKKTAKTVEKTAKVKSIKTEINSDSLREEVRIVFKKLLQTENKKFLTTLQKTKIRLFMQKI